MKTIDLRSDTVTQPTEEMRQAMHKADVGDDAYREDPTVNRLEEMAATISGKEASLFVASGTMGNLISLLTHCQRGDEAIIGDASHIALWEQSGASVYGGISLRTIPNLKNGELALNSVRDAINPDNFYCARTKLICLENTWNGQPLSVPYTKDLGNLARSNKLSLHIDGARIFNAAICLGVPVASLLQNVDSVQITLSKGLCAPTGSLICASKSFIEAARRHRKALGGGMRQIGIIAAAGIVALDKMIDRLSEDHENAKLLANELNELPELKVRPADLRTNIVFFEVVNPDMHNSQLISLLKEQGVLMGVEGMDGIRAVTHYGISSTEIKEVVSSTKKILREFKPNRNLSQKVLS